LLIAGAGVLDSAGLTYVEASVIHAWCAWCITQAAAVTLIFLLWIGARGTEYATATERMRASSRYWTVLMVAIIAGSAAFYSLSRAEKKADEALPPPSAETIAAKVVRPDSHVSGNAQSPVIFVEFGDLQCPSCVASYPVVRQLRNRYGDRVRFAFREYPLETIHMYALGAAEAVECAGRQGKFEPALDRLYAAKGLLDDASLQSYAAEIGLDVPRFRQCLSSDETLPQIRRDQDDAHALGVRATPTFLVGKAGGKLRQVVTSSPTDLASIEDAIAAAQS
jgi:protein-disulfide isomerase